MIRSIPLDSIKRRPDARAVDQVTVSALADSIAEVGLINPLRVRADGDRWEVIAGSHRLAAGQSLGLAELDCIVVDDDDLHAELSMIDENLMRAELSASERATSTARRKAIYEELHPETKHGEFHGNQHARGSRQLGENHADRFTADTSRATGKSERAVQRDAERGEKVIPEVMAKIAGTKLDTGSYLDTLKRLPPNEQVAAVNRDLAMQRAKASKPKRAPVDTDEVRQRQVDALMRAWNNADETARREFLIAVGEA